MKKLSIKNNNLNINCDSFAEKSHQKLSAVTFKLKIYKLVAGFPASNAPWLLAFDFLDAFISIADAQLKQARKEFKAKLSGGHWNPFQGGRFSPDQRAAEFSATFTEQSLRNFAVKVAKEC